MDEEMSRIIINIQDETPANEVLVAIQNIIEEGRISKNNTKYCLGSIFSNKDREIHVYVNPYSKSDVFNVWSELKDE